MLPWNYLEFTFSWDTIAFQPLFSALQGLSGEIMYHKVILLYQPRTDFSLSFLWQVLQLSPVLVGWMPTHSSPTWQHRAQWSTLGELKSSQKKKLAVHQHLLLHSPQDMKWAGGNTEPGESRRDTHQGFSWWKGISPQTPLFFTDQQVTASPNSPGSLSSPVHTA